MLESQPKAQKTRTRA